MINTKHSAAAFLVIAGLTLGTVATNTVFAAATNPNPGSQTGNAGGYQGGDGKGQSTARLTGRQLRRCLDNAADVWLDQTYACHRKFSGNRLRNCLSVAYSLYQTEQSHCHAR